MKSWGNGSRAVIDVEWKNGGEHAFIVENDGGNIKYLDPQDGTKNASYYFTNTKKGTYGLRRLDNAIFSKKAIALAVKNKGDNSIE